MSIRRVVNVYLLRNRSQKTCDVRCLRFRFRAFLPIHPYSQLRGALFYIARIATRDAVVVRVVRYVVNAIYTVKDVRTPARAVCTWRATQQQPPVLCNVHCFASLLGISKKIVVPRPGAHCVRKRIKNLRAYRRRGGRFTPPARHPAPRAEGASQQLGSIDFGFG